MEPIVVSKADYEAGNYPKGVPIMVGMDANVQAGSSMNVGKTPTRIKVTLIPA